MKQAQGTNHNVHAKNIAGRVFSCCCVPGLYTNIKNSGSCVLLTQLSIQLHMIIFQTRTLKNNGMRAFAPLPSPKRAIAICLVHDTGHH